MASTPWKNGWYIAQNNPLYIKHVKGEEVVNEKLAEIGIEIERLVPNDKETWKYGEFGDTPEDIKTKTGVEKYNVEMIYHSGIHGDIKSYGVLSEDKKEIIGMGYVNDITSKKWISDEELEKMKEDSDPFDQMSCPYELKPNKPGKVIWLSGPPGVGKTTTGNLLMKSGEFVCYEADAFLFHINPYLPAAKVEDEI